MVQIKRDWFDTEFGNYEGEKRMADGKRRYKSDRKDYKDIGEVVREKIWIF